MQQNQELALEDAGVDNDESFHHDLIVQIVDCKKQSDQIDKVCTSIADAVAHLNTLSNVHSAADVDATLSTPVLEALQTFTNHELRAMGAKPMSFAVEGIQIGISDHAAATLNGMRDVMKRVIMKVIEAIKYAINLLIDYAKSIFSLLGRLRSKAARLKKQIEKASSDDFYHKDNLCEIKAGYVLNQLRPEITSAAELKKRFEASIQAYNQLQKAIFPELEKAVSYLQQLWDVVSNHDSDDFDNKAENLADAAHLALYNLLMEKSVHSFAPKAVKQIAEVKAGMVRYTQELPLSNTMFFCDVVQNQYDESQVAAHMLKCRMGFGADKNEAARTAALQGANTLVAKQLIDDVQHLFTSLEQEEKALNLLQNKLKSLRNRIFMQNFSFERSRPEMVVHMTKFAMTFTMTYLLLTKSVTDSFKRYGVQSSQLILDYVRLSMKHYTTEPAQ